MYKWQQEWDDSKRHGETDLSMDGMRVALDAIGDALELENEEVADVLLEALGSPLSTESEGSDRENDEESDDDS